MNTFLNIKCRIYETWISNICDTRVLYSFFLLYYIFELKE